MSAQPSSDVDVVAAPDKGFSLHTDRHHVLVVRGELDVLTAPQFASALSSLAAAGGVICVDFSAVGFCGAAGLNVLADAVQTLGPRGRIVIYDPVPRVSRLIAFSDLDVEMTRSRFDPPRGPCQTSPANAGGGDAPAATGIDPAPLAQPCLPASWLCKER